MSAFVDEQATIGATAANGATEEQLSTNGHLETNAPATEEDGGNKFQRAIASWRSLDLTHLVTNLDTVASDLVTQQQDSLVQRKDLAQQTKDFRKLEDAAKLGEIKTLLKSYQNFIDLLTNHSKSVQNAFFQAYQPLSEAPDPYPLLEASIDSLVTAEEVMPKLESENEHLQNAVTKLNSQLEESDRLLDEERSERQSFESSQDTRIKQVEESWSAVMREKEDNWTAKERSLEEKVENQDRLLKEVKASYEVSQRLERSGEDAQESRSGAAAAELEIVGSELERANLRLAEVEARNEQMRTELAQSASHAHSSHRSIVVEDDPAYLRLRSENSSLLRRLDAARFDKDSEKGSWEGKLRSLEREVSAMKSDRDVLQGKVAKWIDYDDVKRELEMLKSIEFATGFDDDDHDTTAEEMSRHPNGTAGEPDGETLEKLLLARNKKLGDDLTLLRVSHQELQSRLEALQEEMSRTNMDLERTRNLNAKLEDDLQRAQQEASNAFETMSVAGTYSSRLPKSAYNSRRGGTSPTSSIISGFDPQQGQGSPRALEALRAGEPVGGGSGILPMVTAQRDRFKKKISELEVELSKTYQTISSLRSEVASLQKDNLNLYEKTRYVSTYNRGGQPTTSSSAYSASPNPSTVQVASDGSGGLDRYRSAYEQNISPFAAFRGRESARAMKRMSLPERAVFQITRMVLATRTSRNLFALYCLGLHILVLSMLYWMGTVDIEKGASHLGAAAVAGAGAGAAGGGNGAELDHGDWKQEGFEASK